LPDRISGKCVTWIGEINYQIQTREPNVSSDRDHIDALTNEQGEGNPEDCD